MRRSIPAAAAPALIALAACAAVPAESAPAATCPISGSSDWAAWVNAMPGPNMQPTLIVTGRLTAPTGGYDPQLRLEQVAESHPVQAFVRLHPNPPSGPATQAVTSYEVRGEWPMSPPVGSVTIRCGDELLARISPVETAQ